MGKPKQIPERKRVAIIGDGKTEFAYIESLKIAFKEKLSAYSLKPRLPKDSSVKELERFIVENLDYDKVLCIIDMDTKLKKQKELTDYLELKRKYRRKYHVIFYETHPCTELWFYYHFQYTTSEFGLFEPELKRQLERKIPGYEKKFPFCTHQHIIKCDGDFDTAVVNGRKSIDSRVVDDRDYTYSEMVRFFEEIGVVGKPDDNK
jgi:hypothetical protein